MLLVIVSVGTSLAIAEAGARLVLHPVDYLLPSVVDDPYLNHRVAGAVKSQIEPDILPSSA